MTASPVSSHESYAERVLSRAARVCRAISATLCRTTCQAASGRPKLLGPQVLQQGRQIRSHGGLRDVVQAM